MVDATQTILPLVESDLMGQLERFNRSTLTPGTNERSEPKTLDELFGTSLYKTLVLTQTLYALNVSGGSETMTEARASPSESGRDPVEPQNWKKMKVKQRPKIL